MEGHEEYGAAAARAGRAGTCQQGILGNRFGLHLALPRSGELRVSSAYVRPDQLTKEARETRLVSIASLSPVSARRCFFSSGFLAFN